MGNSLPGQINHALPQQGWIKTPSTNGTTIWINPRTQEEVQEYTFIVSDDRQLVQEESSYRMRYNSPVLVSGKYFKKHTQQEYCSNLKNGNLYIERVVLRLGQNTKQISYSDVLYIYQQCFVGFGMLLRSVGAFDINQEMICFTKQGYVKVWLHSNLSRSLPDLRFDGSKATEAGMIRRLLDVVQTFSFRKLRPETKTLKEFFKEKGVQSFHAAENALQVYSKTYQIPISTKVNYELNSPKIFSLETQNKSVIHKQNEISSNFSSIPSNSLPQRNHNIVKMQTVDISGSKNYANIASQRPLSSIIYTSHNPNLIHNQNIINVLNFQSKPTPQSARTPPALHHSQSLLNLIHPSNPNMANSNIMNYKNRSQINRQTQSLIHITPQNQIPNFEKRIGQYVKSSGLYPKNHHVFKKHTKKNNNAPFVFNSNLLKGKSIRNSASHNMPQNLWKHNKNGITNFKNVKNQNTIQKHQHNSISNKAKSDIMHIKQGNGRSNQNTGLNFQFTPKSPKPQKFILMPKKQPEKINLHDQQFSKQARKVSQVYLEKGQKRVHTQPNIFSKYFRSEIIAPNGLVFKDANNERFLKPNIVNRIDPKLSKNQHVHKDTVQVSQTKQELPLSFSSKYVLPNTRFAIQQRQTHNISNETNLNVLNIETNPLVFKTFRQQYESIPQSHSNKQNYTFDIHPELLQDMQRIRNKPKNP